MKQCEICNIAFSSGRSYSNHVRWVHKEIKFKTQKCNTCNKEIAQCSIKRHERTCASNKKSCRNCKKEFSSRSNIFCGSSCSASLNNKNRQYVRSYITPEWKEKQRISTKRNWAEGKLKLTRQIFSSKTEREIVNFFKTNFPEDNWKSGGRLILNNTETLSRDMWSDDLKVCFEYDGVWHFKDINGQLAKKQHKDALLEQWCICNNYRLVRIDEDKFESLDQITELIYNKTETIIKIGDRY